MADLRKAKILINATYSDGTPIKNNYSVPARVSTLTIPKAPDKFVELAIRMVVDSKISEELLEGLCRGEVELIIDKVPALVERR